MKYGDSRKWPNSAVVCWSACQRRSWRRSKRAPCGNEGPHPLFRDPRPHLADPRDEWRECHWEEALWRKYGQDNSAAVPGLWARLISYQVMLRDTNKGDAGWGEID